MTQESDEADRLWATLGDPMRLRLLNLLLERDEATASALATTLPASHAKASPSTSPSRSPARAIAPPHSIFGSAAEAVIRPGTHAPPASPRSP
jgi:hypothetical protein